jgi:hypothetical protein
MTAGHFIVGLTAIVLISFVTLYIGILWRNRSTDNPIEHGDGEP